MTYNSRDTEKINQILNSKYSDEMKDKDFIINPNDKIDIEFIIKDLEETIKEGLDWAL